MYILKFLQEVELYQAITIVLLLGLLGGVVWYFFFRKKLPPTVSDETSLVLYKKPPFFSYRFFVSFFSHRIGDNIENVDDEKLKTVYALNRTRLWICWFFGYIFITFIMIFILKHFEIKNPIKIVSLSISLHFIVSLFNIIRENERGAVYFFERPLYITGRGIQPVPAGVCTLKRELRTIFKDELPNDESKIYRPQVGEANFVPPELLDKGYKSPLRVTFKGKKETEGEETDDPLKKRVTVEIPGIVIWRVRDLIKFKSTIGTPEKAREQMADLYIAIITAELPKVTLSEFYERKGDFDTKIEAKLEELTDNWGIEINSAKIKEPGQSRKLNTKIQEMAESVAEKVAAENRGKGRGEEEKGTLRGRTAGYKKMMEETGLDIKDVVASETALKVAERVDNFTAVGSKGISDVLNIIAASKGIFQTKDKAEKKEVNNDE